MRRRVPWFCLLLCSPSAAWAHSRHGGRSAAPTSAPSVHPASLSHFDLARKDCLGNGPQHDSKIWYTVANGVLSDVYAPTIDTTNVETMQYLVTDGSTFTDLQTRDTTYTVSADPTGMICTVTSTAKSRQVPTDHHVPDRHRARQRRRPHPVHAADARPQALPAVRPARRDGRRQRRRRRSRQRRRRLRRSSTRRPAAGAGLVRHGDHHERGQPRLRRADLPRAARRPAVRRGQQRLRRHAERRADPAGRGARADARVRQTPRAATSSRPPPSSSAGTASATLALGFGTTQAAAVATAGATRTHLAAAAGRRSTSRGWQHYDAGLHAPVAAPAGLDRRAAGGGGRRSTTCRPTS